MNAQLDKTIKAISPDLASFIEMQEKAFNAQANITIEKIDRSLLLTQGEIEEISDIIFIDIRGLPYSLYSSCYYALFPRGIVAIPCRKKKDFELIQKGIDILDFLIDKDDTENLKAIIHVDVHKTYSGQENTDFFRIQVSTPKKNKTPTQLVKAEVERRGILAKVRELKEELRAS